MKTLFINLPVANLDAAKNFYAALGCQHNPQFSNPTTICMLLSEKITLMLHNKDSYGKFLNTKAVVEKELSEMMLDIILDSKEEVDETFNKAIAAGGKEQHMHPASEAMYCKSFSDLDGHLWEACWMNEAMLKMSKNET